MQQQQQPRVLIVGTGGLGTIVACAIKYKGQAHVSVVVRSDFKHVNEHGWKITSCDYGNHSNWKPDAVYPTIEDASKAGVYDYVVVTTKNIPEISKVEDLVEPVITEKLTTVVLIQNGFDLGRPFVRKYPENMCLSGVSYICSTNHDGVINHTKTDETLISYFNNDAFTKDQQRDRCMQFIDIYKNDKNIIKFEDDVKTCRYNKLVWNATYNTICALTGLDIGRLEMAGTLDSLAVPAMREVMKVAKADGVELSHDLINTLTHITEGRYYKPSMQLDVERSNPLENEVILGNVLVVAKELGVETPILNVIYQLLRAVQFRIMEEKGYVSVPEVCPKLTKYYS